MTLPLLCTIANHRDPLPAATLTGLLAVAASSNPYDQLRTLLIGRADVTAAQARSLLTDPPAWGQLHPYLERPDTDPAYVLTLRDDDLQTAIASRTARPELLHVLAAATHDPTLRAVARNKDTPHDAAVTALARAMDNRASWGADASEYTWAAGLPRAIVHAWAATSTNLLALTGSLTSEMVPPDLLEHVLDVAAAALPSEAADLATHKPVLLALRILADQPDCPARRRAIDLLTERGDVVRGEPAAAALRLNRPNPHQRLPLAQRSWRKVSQDVSLAPELATLLTERLGANPAAWRLLDVLGASYRGTVEDLLLAVHAAASPSAADTAA